MPQQSKISLENIKTETAEVKQYVTVCPLFLFWGFVGRRDLSERARYTCHGIHGTGNYHRNYHTISGTCTEGIKQELEKLHIKTGNRKASLQRSHGQEKNL